MVFVKVLLTSEPGVDGVLSHVDGLCRYLERRGVDLALAYSSKRGSKGLENLLKFLRSRGVATLDLKIRGRPGFRDALAFWKLFRFARRVRPDVVHCHSSKGGVVGRCLALVGLRAEYIYTPHAYFGMGGRPGPMSWVYNAVEASLGRRIGKTINVSEDEAEFARNTLGIPRQRITVIPNPVPAERFVPSSAEAKAEAKRALGCPREAILLGWMGRSVYQKDPHTLYRAFALTRETNDNLWLYHVGHGELDKELSMLARELGILPRLIRRPYLDKPEEFYQAIDALVLTSRYEGLPLVVLEALACDLPLVTSLCPGTSNITSNGLTHLWTADVDNAGSFAAAIHSWIVARANARPCNHRIIAVEKYGCERCYGAVLDYYKAALLGS